MTETSEAQHYNTAKCHRNAAIYTLFEKKGVTGIKEV
jgi:hypothetical protein